jgi:predicted RNA-binding Zn-ribbon protein involved in translation (DUF1610 family)
MEIKRFTKNDAGFVCKNCGFKVQPLGKTSRNHCPRCLCSIHIDINPGDRASECLGLLVPIFCEPDPKKGYVITHKCKKCGDIRRNKAALKLSVKDTLPDDQYDSEELLIKLTVCRE